MENKDNLKIGVAMIVCLIVGAMMGRASTISNTSKNDNSSKVFISQEVPDNFEKNSKILKKIEKNSKILKKININTATLGEFKDAKVGIGEVKYNILIDCRPFENTRELIDKGVIGYYVYNKHKDRFVVGD